MRIKGRLDKVEGGSDNNQSDYCGKEEPGSTSGRRHHEHNHDDTSDNVGAMVNRHWEIIECDVGKRGERLRSLCSIGKRRSHGWTE